MALDLSAYRRRQAQRAALTLAYVLREWGGIGEDFDSGWARIGPRLTVLVAAGQLGAATAADAYLTDVLDDEPVAALQPRALAGVASDGRPLATLLYGAVVRARTAQVDSLAARLEAGASFLTAAVPTQVSDAGRDASRLAAVARPHVEFVRLATAPCCQRCAVLAGRIYRYSEKFKRHPGCDCSMMPTTVAAPDAPGRVIGPEDVRDLTGLQRKAIADGHDMNKVINDYNRSGQWHLPPTRVERITSRAASRDAAVRDLTRAGLLAA